MRWFAEWRRYCALLGLLFLLRGLFLLSVFPPWEGWDEYQHVAYVAYLVENDDPPILLESRVPKTVLRALLRYPHGKFALQQVRQFGGVSYDEFRQLEDPPPVAADQPSIGLYQAQHSPLYYRLMAPVFRHLWNERDPLPLIAALRWINVLFGAAAVVIAAMTLPRILTPGPHRYAVALLIALQPMFLFNSARVANDALAVLLGTVAVCILLTRARHRPVLAAAIGGAALGLAILAKTVNLALLPFAVVVFLIPGDGGRTSLKRRCVSAALMLAVVATLTAPYFLASIERFGSLTPMQEAVENQRQDRGFTDLLRAIPEVNWVRRFSHRYSWAILIEGGWSYLKPPRAFFKAHQFVVAAAALGWCLAWRARRHGRWIFAAPGTVPALFVLGGGMMLGLAYHSLQGLLAFGGQYTNIWYAAVTFPWLLCLFYQGAACWPGRHTAAVITAAVAIIFISAEVWTILGVMVPEYAGGGAFWEAATRAHLARLHPPGCGPVLTIPALLGVLGVAAIAFAVWARAGGAEPPITGPESSGIQSPSVQG